MTSLNLSAKNCVPFVTGYAQQQYLPAEQGILLAKHDQCDYWYIDGSLESEIPQQWSKKRITSLRHLIDEHQVQPIFHGNFKAPLASDVDEMRKAAVAYAKKEIDLAAWLDAPLILHGSVVVEPRLIRQVKQTALENYLQSVTELQDYALQKDVSLYLENLCNYKYYRPFHYIFTQREEIDYILSQLGEVYLFLDVGHANVGGGDPVDLILRYHHRIIGMSLSNNDGNLDQHLGLNKGTIDYTAIVKAMIDTNWQGIIGFETRGKTTVESIAELTAIYQTVIRTGEHADSLGVGYA